MCDERGEDEDSFNCKLSFFLRSLFVLYKKTIREKKIVKVKRKRGLVLVNILGGSKKGWRSGEVFVI